MSGTRLLAVIGLMFGLSLQVGAATYYASPSGTPGGAGTEADPYDLQTAVENATEGASAADGDVVRLLDGTYKLSSMVTVDKYITLCGNPGDRRAVVLDGGNSVTCLQLKYGTVRDLTVSNGTGTTSGGIVLQHRATVDNCVVTHCRTTGNGAGISGAWVGGSNRYYVRDSEICHCTQTSDGNGGGGLLVCCGMVSNCFVHSNTAVKHAGLTAWCEGATAGARILGCVISNNVASSDGGAMGDYWQELRGCTFVDNVSPSRGGALAVRNTAAYTNAVYDCQFIGNTAKYNGAICATQPFMVLSNCTFCGCSASDNDGGAVGGTDSAATVFTIYDSVFTNCTAKGTGGALYLTAPAANGTHRLVHCDFQVCKASQGGAIFMGAGCLEATNCTFRGCKVTTAGNYYAGGGAVRINTTEEGARADFRECKFIANATPASNGNAGVMCGGCGADGALGCETVTFVKCLFEGNVSSLKTAGVCQNGGSYSFFDCDFRDMSPTRNGAALYSYGGVSSFDLCRFNNISNTTANQNGPVIYAEGGFVKVVNSAFTNCISKGNAGAVFAGGKTEELLVSNVTFYGCLAGSAGASVYMSGKCGKIANCSVVGSRGTYANAALYLKPSDTTRPSYVRNCLFTDCADLSGTEREGYVFEVYPGVTVENCTLSGNLLVTGAVARKPVYMKGGLMNNCIVWGNGPQNASGQVATEASINFENAAYNASVSNCLVKTGSHGGPSVADAKLMGWVYDVDPAFTDAANGDYSIGRASGAKDKGLVQPWMSAARDLAGHPRLRGGSVDIGAYQYYTAPGLMIILR